MVDRLNTQSLLYLEDMYAQFLRDPNAVPAEWRDYFERLPDGDGQRPAAARLGPSFRPSSIFSPPAVRGNGAVAGDELQLARLQERVDKLIRNYRVRGHMVAKVDPLGLPRPSQPELDLAHYGFREEHLRQSFSTTTIRGANLQTLEEILARLQNTYCRFIGVQFMHIDDLTVREWLQRRMEGTENRLDLSRDEQIRILTRLTDAVIFEEFVRKKYVGAKTFSLEGAESLIPLLDLAIEKVGEQGMQEVVLGMAHRGRLNVLHNIIGKSAQVIFREFEDVDHALYHGSGDVKYHLGYSNDWVTTSGHRIHLSLSFNPSHLEFVNPVVLGRIRAKQDRVGDRSREKGMAFLIHGDAAFAGEGIVQESLQLSELPGYTTGGTLHIVVNNQLGFTTPPGQGRSSTYATDVAKMLQIPIFHVNGEHPEAVAQVVNLALDFRKTFRRDAVIDMYCFRRWGHNEGDEPEFTQPVLYDAIEHRASVRDAYLAHLLELGGITEAEADEIAEKRRAHLEREFSVARSDEYVPLTEQLTGVWAGYHGGKERLEDDVETGVDQEQLCHLLERLTHLPEGFHLHRKLRRGFEQRRSMARGEHPIDWSTGEALALASLAIEGHRVRMSGQDSERGTFSQRHAVLHDTEDGRRYMPLAHVAKTQAPVEIFNSPLSEAGVLGFEYGFSLDYPDALVMWEAQFGDFVNAAQVIVDQFLASAEAKWRRLSGVVLLLPHGFEGQGPEHSSARLERFLTLAAEENLQVAQPSTPAQYFHLLRRQAIRRWRKPLVVLTPKSLLRHPRVVSSLEECATGRFHRVLPERQLSSEVTPERILLCSGKIYYELLARREKLDRSDAPIVRLEQFYPMPEAQLEMALEMYPPGTPAYWVQEEPENMGAWPFLKVNWGEELLGRFPLRGVSRPASASPATGSTRRHQAEQEDVLTRAFAAT